MLHEIKSNEDQFLNESSFLLPCDLSKIDESVESPRETVHHELFKLTNQKH